MGTGTSTEAAGGRNNWNLITHALLAAFVAWNTLLWVAIELGRHSHQFPTGAAQPFAWVVAIGISSYLLLPRELNVGHVLTGLTAVLGIFSMALIAAGPHGPPPGDPAIPVLFVVFGPGGYTVFALILIITTVLARRRRGGV